MSYKCRICASNDVEHPDDICEICAIGADPYAANMSSVKTTPEDNGGYTQQTSNSSAKRNGRKVLLNGGSSVANQDPYGNDMTPYQKDESVQVYSAGQVPQSVTHTVNNVNTTVQNNTTIPQFVTSGITKNITVDNQKRSILTKWFASLFKGIPFALDDDITMFQVFPDFSGTALNSMGNACDQVIVYGKLNNGTISENNDVEVYGRRDSNNNIIAKTIRNKASGTTISPMRCMESSMVWVITIIVAALIFALIMGLGVEGIVWTIVAVLCLTNLPMVLKVFGAIFGALFSFFKRLF